MKMADYFLEVIQCFVYLTLLKMILCLHLCVRKTTGSTLLRYQEQNVAIDQTVVTLVHAYKFHMWP